MVSGVGGLVVAVALVAVLGRGAGTATATQITTFQTAIAQPIQHWGKIEVLGMRPAVQDLIQGSDLPSETIGAEASAWQDGLRQVGQQLAAANVPGVLSHSMSLFKQALSAYMQAAILIQKATAVQGAARTSLLDQAAQTAQHGDCIYDDASLELQHARIAAGLGTTRDFPDQPCSGGATP